MGKGMNLNNCQGINGTMLDSIFPMQRGNEKDNKEQKIPAEIQDSLFILVGRLVADTKKLLHQAHAEKDLKIGLDG